LKPANGRILFDGRDVTDASPEERNIAQVFQFPVIYDTMTVYQNLAFPLRNRSVAAPEVDRRVREVANMLELEAMLDRRASGLTADTKQKISLGRGLVRSDVNVIMFDEPLTVIDPHLKWVLRSQLKKLHQRIRRTMIYVTHDQTEALTFADQVVVMKDGEVVQIGTPIEPTMASLAVLEPLKGAGTGRNTATPPSTSGRRRRISWSRPARRAPASLNGRRFSTIC
jgi:glycerol transport system ATP-binding protein